ncbi:MAG: biopolymer transporter ExbD [Bdellovibrionota bacterium]
MGIKIPSYHLTASKDLPEMRFRLKGKGAYKNQLSTSLTITSLIDMFAALIFFLLHTFGASGEIDFINPAIEIPPSEHALLLKRAPVITVMRDKVTLEGGSDKADSNLNIAGKIEETDWELPQLKEKLLEYKKFFESIHQDVKYPPEVIIQADKGLEFLYIKRVLFTLTKIGFSNVTVAVRGKVNVEGSGE